MKHFLTLLIICSLCCACATTSTTPGKTDTLEGLQRLGASSYQPEDKVSSIRQQAIQEIALSLGAQGALAQRSQQINQTLTQNDKTLERIFNFHAMMLGNNILPPVLTEGRQSLNLADPNTLRIVDRTYKIENQARFVTGVPNWRDYLWMNFSKPDKPNNSLLPKNNVERTIWKEYIAKGWKDGLKQADSIYAENLARLKRDYNGMVLYRKLLAQGMVSAPYVGRTNLGVTGGGSDMRVNDQVLRITALPNLQPRSKDWKPVFTQ